jgi:HD-like signal output (HDOD) protein
VNPVQWHWGLEQWVEFLKHKDTPVLPATRTRLAELQATQALEGDQLSARGMADILYTDPYLALKLLRRAEERRSRQLGTDTTTPIATVLQTGYDDLQEIAAASPPYGEQLPGCHVCEARSIMASAIARTWAGKRVDISPDEVAMAALLAETGELMLWHFAPEMTDKETRVRDWNERYWALQMRPSEIEFTFRQLSMALAQAWELPNLIVMLIKGTDTPRANIARLAADAAKLITNDPTVPGLLDVLRDTHQVIPTVSLGDLAEALPLADEIRTALLAEIAATEAAQDARE